MRQRFVGSYTYGGDGPEYQILVGRPHSERYIGYIGYRRRYDTWDAVRPYDTGGDIKTGLSRDEAIEWLLAQDYSDVGEEEHDDR